MQKRVLASLLVSAAIACGSSSAHHRVAEAPIDDNIKRPTDLPPDEVGGSGSTSTTSATGVPEHGPPPGVGPQPLEGPDAGASAASGGDAGSSASGFTQRSGGLSERDCNDLVMKYAKMMTKETKAATPSAADLPKDPIYGQMITECGKSTTKKQQKCAAATRTSAAWKKCME